MHRYWDYKRALSRPGFIAALACIAAVGGVSAAGAAQPAERARVLVRLEDAIVTALENNRDLQIERLNPSVARANLSSSYGYYDPVFLGDVRRETDVETGGFDPLNFSADAVYEADTLLANGGLTGFLPSGMSYNVGGNYSHSAGTRNSLDFDSYRVFTGVTVSQPLLRNMWIDGGRYAIKINKRNVQITELGVRFIAMDIINRVQSAYYELSYAHEAQRIGQLLIDARQGMLYAVQRRIQEGMATLPDEQLAQAQLAAAETTFSSAMTSVELAENALRTHLGDSFTNQVNTRWVPADHVLLVPQSFDLVESWERGVRERPDLAQLRVQVERSKIDVRYRFNQLFPTVNLMAGYGRRGSSTDQDVAPFTPRASLHDVAGQLERGDAPKDMVGVLFSMPLTRKAERGSYQAAKHLRTQAELLVKQKEEFVLREISDAVHTARTSYERALAARKAVAASRAALEAEEKRLSGGTSSIFFVLQLQNDLVSSQLIEARARADYNTALAQWQFTEGTSLERRNIIAPRE